MMAASFQASYASAPDGRPRLPMLRRLALWKCTVNINLRELHYTSPTLYTIPRIPTLSSLKIPATRNQVWCFMSFPLLSHVFCFVLMQKIANVYSPSTYGSMRVLLHFSMKELECPIDRKKTSCPIKGYPYPSTKFTTLSAKARMRSCHHGARIEAPKDNPEPF